MTFTYTHALLRLHRVTVASGSFYKVADWTKQITLGHILLSEKNIHTQATEHLKYIYNYEIPKNLQNLNIN